MSKDSQREEALAYHRLPHPGKISVQPTKPCVTQRDLSLAYSPGVAEPCLAIAANPELADEYTARANLVAVISNGTAVLGLGNIGPLASKPVMEGKGVLFKRFADIDVFDLEIAETDPMAFVETVARLEPTFGGINLEDIKAPECFIIEEELKKRVSIPVLHDDQHGTAVITAAGLLNALILQDKRIEDVTIVCLGAGAAGFACMKLIEELGARRENILFLDRSGVIHKDQADLPPHKAYFATERPERTLDEAMCGADVFVGLSQGNMVSPDMLRSLADKPIVFAMANPTPEIDYDVAMATRKDLIMATGRSDHPNQVNNVLCFPFLFRGALDTHASAINDEMKMAACLALADLAKQDVPDAVRKAYGNIEISFGRDYLIPKPFDPRVLLHVAPAVARAAMESGVARQPIKNMETYQECLEALQGRSKEIMRALINKAKAAPKRVVFPEGEEEKILRAAQILVDEGIAIPILLGDKEEIYNKIEEHGLELKGVQVIDPATAEIRGEYIDEMFTLRQRKGITRAEAKRLIKKNRNYYGAMMLQHGDADALLSGLNHHYPETIRPALEIIGKQEGLSKVHGLYMMVFKKDVVFCADTTVTIEPTAEELAETAILTAQKARHFNVEPRIAMLSFSNFGSAEHPLTMKVKRATALVKEWAPDLVVDGEMQANVALDPELTANQYPFSKLKGNANVLIFPDLQSGNISYKLLNKLGGAEAVGPILMGMKKPVHVLQRGDDVSDIISMAAVAVVDAQEAMAGE